jgi:hypothetical protein
VTGKPFGYRGGNGEATLEVESDSPGSGGVEYRLTVGG